MEFKRSPENIDLIVGHMFNHMDTPYYLDIYQTENPAFVEPQAIRIGKWECSHFVTIFFN